MTVKVGTFVVVGRGDRKAGRRTGYALLPVLAAIAALFMVLSSSTPGVRVEMRGGLGSFGFSPASVSLRAGGALTFENNSRSTHTATCDGCSLDTGDVQPGQTRTLRFSRPGNFTVFCRYHRLSDREEMTVEVSG